MAGPMRKFLKAQRKGGKPTQDTPMPYEASLFGIPAELRNRIYAYALVQSSPIDFGHKSNRDQPALLKVCRQLRSEAMRMYYEENKLIVTVHNYDATVAMAAYAMVLKYHAHARKKFRIEMCGNCTTVHVCTLIKWLKAYHADPKVPSLRQDRAAEEGDDQTLARRTFGVVQSMRSKPWKDVQEVLGAFFRAVISYQDTMAELYGNMSDDDDDEDSEEDDSEDSEDETDDENDDLPTLEPVQTHGS